MPKDLYTFPCPCCGKQIEIDTRTGKARAVKPGEQKDAKDLDSLLTAQQKEAERLAQMFDQAKQGQGKQKEHLDRLLERAKEDAKKTKDEKLKRPWDLE